MKATVITLFVVGLIAISGGVVACGKPSEHYDDGSFIFPIALIAIGVICEILSALMFVFLVLSRI